MDDQMSCQAMLEEWKNSERTQCYFVNFKARIQKMNLTWQKRTLQL